jgi:gamma-glutamylcyclotransferase (GGCT)/AIG2-like uncharacterized protein YtfP
MTNTEKPDTSRHLVFVYGTLMRGLVNNDFLRSATFMGEAETVRSGFHMTTNGAYPAVFRVHDDGEAVKGELWSADSTTLASMDRLEGVDHAFYQRATETVRCQPEGGASEQHRAWIYLGLDWAKQQARVPGCDWRHFLELRA